MTAYPGMFRGPHRSGGGGRAPYHPLHHVKDPLISDDKEGLQVPSNSRNTQVPPKGRSIHDLHLRLGLPPKADPEARIQVQVVYLGRTSKGMEKCSKERKEQ